MKKYGECLFAVSKAAGAIARRDLLSQIKMRERNSSKSSQSKGKNLDKKKPHGAIVVGKRSVGDGEEIKSSSPDYAKMVEQANSEE